MMLRRGNPPSSKKERHGYHLTDAQGRAELHGVCMAVGLEIRDMMGFDLCKAFDNMSRYGLK